MKLTDEQKKFFIREGYVILPGFVDQDYIDNALSFLDKRIASGNHGLGDKTRGKTDPSVKFGKPAKRAPEITDLIFKTGLLELAEDLLGEGNATVRDNLGQIAYNEPRKDLIAKGTDISMKPSKHRWHIDSGHGKYASLGSDFSVLVGVALSDGQQVDENRGQFTFFPKSHFITHPALGEVIKKNPNGNATNEFIDKGVADIGEPMRGCLAPGDALICHQRLAHCPGINLWEKVRINIYFRIVHALIDDILDDQVLSPTPWVGFDGLKALLPPGSVEYTDRSLPPQVKERKLPKFAKKYKDISHPRDLAESVLELIDEQKRSFIDDGYVVIPGAVSEDLVKKALAFTDQAYEENQYNMNGSGRPGSKDPMPSFHKPIQRSEEVLGLFYKSGLYGAAEQLLGEGNVDVRDGQGQILYNCPNEISIDEGMDMKKPLPKRRWSLDPGRGKYKQLGSDFAFRIGVCLSDGQDVDENRGQLTVWPGSHFLTHPVMGEVIESSPADGVMRIFRSKKLDAGSQKRVLLRPGDVVIAHQRLPNAMAMNLTNAVAKHVYFRVVHAQMDDFMDTFIKSPTPWTGFKGLQSLLPEGATSWTGSGEKKKTNAMKRLLNASSVAKSVRSVILTEEQLACFVRDGYVIVPGAVPADLVDQALEYLDEAMESKRYEGKGKDIMGSEKQAPEFRKNIKRASQVKDLFYQSGLLQACEQLIGEGSVMVLDGMSDVSYISQSEVYVKEGMDMKEPFPKNKGHVLNHKSINQSRGAGSHNVLVGVAISEGQEVDENRGQLIVWPGSHIKSHQALGEIVRENENDPSANLSQQLRKKKLDYGKPVRVLLKSGDAVIVHQRLVKAQGINLREQVRKAVYFPVHHDMFHNQLKEFVSAELPFHGFEGEKFQDVVAKVFKN